MSTVRKKCHAIVEPETRLMNHHPIRPYDIKLRDNGCTPIGSFGKYEAEKSAGTLIRFFQHKGYWAAFEFSEFKKFCAANSLIDPRWGDADLLYGLGQRIPCKLSSGFVWESSSVVVALPDGKLAITREFIRRCAGEYKRPSKRT